MSEPKARYQVADTGPLPAITEAARERLIAVVGRLVADCLRWYAQDEKIIEKMGEEELERMVLDYLRKRDYYSRESQ